MGNKGSKAEGAQQAAAPAPAAAAAATTTSHPTDAPTTVIPVSTHNEALPTEVMSPSNGAQPLVAATGPTAVDKQVEQGLAEFGNTDRITADDAYNHWDKSAAAATQGGEHSNSSHESDDIGGNKVRNKELEKTMRQTMRNTMCNGDLRQLVKLPPNADLNEWIALNTIHFYRTCVQIGRNYREFCTPEKCPLMSAGNVEYLWRDNRQYPKPTRVPACRYVELALQEAYETIEDPQIFPSDETQPFPQKFLQRVKEIFKRLFRQFAHLYYSHYDQVKASGSSKHLNSTFKHFIYFVLEFGLIDSASLQPLQKFIDHIVQQNPSNGNGGPATGSAGPAL